MTRLGAMAPRYRDAVVTGRAYTGTVMLTVTPQPRAPTPLRTSCCPATHRMPASPTLRHRGARTAVRASQVAPAPDTAAATPCPTAGFGVRALQPKLAIGAVDDPAEHEADRAADQVMRTPARPPSIGAAVTQVSRMCAGCAHAGDDTTLHRQPAAPARPLGAAPPIVAEVLHTPGHPLDPSSRAFFEQRFGHNFSDVRIHTDALAAESAKSVGALAYTVGSDIVYAAGHYRPSSQAGQRLTAHELSHVIQQRPETLARQPAPAASTPTPQEVIAAANTRRVGTLLYALSELADVISTDKLGLTPNPYTFTLPAIQRWLHVGPGDPNFAATLQAVEDLYLRNLKLNPVLKYQSNTVRIDPFGNACPPNYAYSRAGVSPIYICDNFLAKGINCQRDIMIHEHFHLLGLAKEDYGAPTTARALKSPDSLAQLAAEIADGPHTASCLGSD